ncbi:hypothetical protein [Nonomuraea sp. LPB2021202275-12-8]|uniref:hypothetical protein n=1 Tax=Nonomuraea sp. LPB2021202275-12-8 TaxID=3120159 RepID=UPI00300C4C43
MLKEAFAAGALVAAAFVPSAAPQAQTDNNRAAGTPAASASLTSCASVQAAKCYWLEKKKKRCLLCKNKKGQWKQKHCEAKSAPAKPPPANPKPDKPKEEEEGVLCKPHYEEGGEGEGKTCQTCKNLKTGKVVSTTCKPVVKPG